MRQSNSPLRSPKRRDVTVRVDITEVQDLTARATESFERQFAQMREVLEGKAAEERATHEYQNRSHNLEDSTKVEDIEESASTAEYDLVAGMDYASFVNRRGLMRIDDLAAEADTEIQYLLEGEAEALGSR